MERPDVSKIAPLALVQLESYSVKPAPHARPNLSYAMHAVRPLGTDDVYISIRKQPRL